MNKIQTFEFFCSCLKASLLVPCTEVTLKKHS